MSSSASGSIIVVLASKSCRPVDSDRNSDSTSGVIKPSSTRISPSSKFDFDFSCSATCSWSSEIRPRSTSRSPMRTFEPAAGGGLSPARSGADLPLATGTCAAGALGCSAGVAAGPAGASACFGSARSGGGSDGGGSPPIGSSESLPPPEDGASGAGSGIADAMSSGEGDIERSAGGGFTEPLFSPAFDGSFVVASSAILINPITSSYSSSIKSDIQKLTNSEY